MQELKRYYPDGHDRCNAWNAHIMEESCRKIVFQSRSRIDFRNKLSASLNISVECINVLLVEYLFQLTISLLGNRAIINSCEESKWDTFYLNNVDLLKNNIFGSKGNIEKKGLLVFELKGQ